MTAEPAPDSDVRWLRATDVLWRMTARGALLLHLDADEPVMVDGAGAMIWELIETPITTADLAARLANVYDADTDTIAADATRLLGELRQMKLADRC